MRLASGLLGLFRVRSAHPAVEGGKMALADHIRELRGRVLRVIALMFIALILGLVFYDELLVLVTGPYNQARLALGEDTLTQPVIIGIASPLLFQLKLAGISAVVLTSPFWLYQIWAFVVPGLHANERKWSRIFASVAGPLFLLGVATGYYVLPTGIEVLIGFTPEGVQNLVDFNTYFTFFVRMLLVFGVSFEIPLFVLMLNLAGVVSGKTLGEYRGWIIVVTFVFAAVATPSTDPFSMIMLALPMTLLFMISEVIARVLDKRHGHSLGTDLDDDDASDLTYDTENVERSSLDESDD